MPYIRDFVMKASGKLSIILAIILYAHMLPVCAQEKFGGSVEFDRTVWDFGDVLLSDGALECQFRMKNIGNKPVVIYNVTTTCGCTDVTWSREPVQPGKTAVISATYTNDEGPYPFDKALTAHISGVGRPVILRIRGVSHQKEEPLDVRFPLHSGKLGLKGIDFSGVSDGLSLETDPNPVPAGSTATLHFRVDAVDGIWGKNYYYATPVIDGKPSGLKLKIFAFTKASFDDLTGEQRDNGPKPIFKSSTYSFGKIRPGTQVTASWEFTNIGRSTFKAYKVDVDAEHFTCTPVPEVGANAKGCFSVTLDTTGMPEGETLVMVTLTTNSPVRPIVNLFITGWIE